LPLSVKTDRRAGGALPAADFTFCPFPSGNQQDRAATNDHQERSCSERIAIGYYGSPAIELLGSGLVWPALIYACASGKLRREQRMHRAATARALLVRVECIHTTDF
jgi:hypothetical protein